ncbi:MAG: hypothetical protein ACOY3M_02160 [Patescibacteria group bacterium]
MRFYNHEMFVRVDGLELWDDVSTPPPLADDRANTIDTLKPSGMGQRSFWEKANGAHCLTVYKSARKDKSIIARTKTPFRDGLIICEGCPIPKGAGGCPIEARAVKTLPRDPSLHLGPIQPPLL